MFCRLLTSKSLFPYTFNYLDKEEDGLVKEYFKGDLSAFIRVGPEKCLLTEEFIKEASNIFNLPLHTGDVFVIGYPRSGTTWTQELVWLLVNNLDYVTAKTIPVFERYAFLEYSMLFNEKAQKKHMIKNQGNKQNLALLKRYGTPGAQIVMQNSSPCFIKTHLPFSLLPLDTLDIAKVVYIIRDPRDVAVSFFHQNKLFKFINFTGDFKAYWNLFINDLILFGPYFQNIKQAWKKRHHPNMLILFYEELKLDMPKVLPRVADFFGKKFTQTQLKELESYLSFESFKKNSSINRDEMRKLGMLAPGETFLRKGQVGGWREYFDEEMKLQADRWIATNLQDTDFRFPHLDNN